MNMQLQRNSKILAKALKLRHEDKQWEIFIVSMLKKLELSTEKRSAAEARYEKFGHHVASKLGMNDDDVHVVVQGSMRTQTTIAGDGREKFDLDVVVKLSGPRFTGLRESEAFFQLFGESLRGIEGAGVPEAKSRCWRLPYPGERFYFDVTPAIPMSQGIIGTFLRVRDKETVWSPSNPEEFADWFCAIAGKKFPFQRTLLIKAEDARAKVDPIPQTPIGLDDILRRLVQLMKLHRDNYYRKLPDARGDARPISVILVTLATKAYDKMVSEEPNAFDSSIEVVLEVVARMPEFIERHALIRVDNPAMQGAHIENFADRWNKDGGARNREFEVWHNRLTQDLEALFSEEYSKRSEERVRAVFGELGVQAWKNTQPSASPNILSGLLASSGTASAQPQQPRKIGSRDTLA
ncbi:nucleotidyltransferase [Pseudomonas syringae]|uniref:nucleotidyltransferase domain-containing protein n=1 Tax=Pseudomonas syringae TaxID=317 RepID=UPI0004229ED5|nr:nucleotidyltransferase [Pseudomonas syringae]